MDRQRSLTSGSRRFAAVAGGLVALCAGSAQAGWAISIGTGFAFGGCGGWGSPVVSIGTTWTSDGYGCYGGPWYGGYGGGYYGGGWGGYPCSSYYAPRRYCAPRPYCPPVYTPCGTGYAAAPASRYGNSDQTAYASAEAPASAVRMAASPRPVAPTVPTETNTARGWRLLEAGDKGAMEAFGRAVARSESADAYLGYSICAAKAGQTDRAEWSARTAMTKDAQVLARAPEGKGVKAAAAEALARYTQKTRGRGETAEFTVAVLREASGDAQGAADAASRLVGGDVATRRLVAAVGAAPLLQATPAANQLAAAPSGVKPASPTTPGRRIVVAVKPDATAAEDATDALADSR